MEIIDGLVENNQKCLSKNKPSLLRQPSFVELPSNLQDLFQCLQMSKLWNEGQLNRYLCNLWFHFMRWLQIQKADFSYSWETRIFLHFHPTRHRKSNLYPRLQKLSIYLNLQKLPWPRQRSVDNTNIKNQEIRFLPQCWWLSEDEERSNQIPGRRENQKWEQFAKRTFEGSSVIYGGNLFVYFRWILISCWFFL